MLLTRVINSRFSMRLLGTFVTKTKIKVEKKKKCQYLFRVCLVAFDTPINITKSDKAISILIWTLFQQALQIVIIDLTGLPEMFQTVEKVYSTGSYKV